MGYGEDGATIIGVVTIYFGMTRSPESAVMREPVVFSLRCSTPTNCQEMCEP